MARCHHIPAIPGVTISSDTDFCEITPPNGSQEIVADASACGTYVTSPMTMADSCENKLFDCWASEVINTSGISVNYYVLDREHSERDAVYDEAINICWRGPYEVMAVFSYNGRTLVPLEQGLTADFRAKITISRMSFEALGLEMPRVGDVIHVWDTAFYAKWASIDEEIRGSGMYFDVVEILDAGHTFDGPFFTNWELDVKRITTFTPERKVYGDGDPTTR